MKKIFLLITLIFLGINVSNAKDILPVRPNINQVNSIGLYQIGDDVKIFKSKTLRDCRIPFEVAELQKA